jgi:hypothetical protein
MSGRARTPLRRNNPNTPQYFDIVFYLISFIVLACSVTAIVFSSIVFSRHYANGTDGTDGVNGTNGEPFAVSVMLNYFISNATYTVPVTIWNTIPFNTPNISSPYFNLTTFTVPVNGTYQIFSQVQYNCHAPDNNTITITYLLNSTTQLASVVRSFDVIPGNTYNNYLLIPQIANLYAGQQIWSTLRYVSLGNPVCSILESIQGTGSSFFIVYRIA